VTTYQIDPIEDPRWERLSLEHPQASVFHSPGWLKALRNAYGYEPIALTTTAPGHELADGIVFCRVRSWLTGNRLVSLPFSDHCEPLVENGDELPVLLASLWREADALKCRYTEIRPLVPLAETPTGIEKAETFCFHRLDLGANADALFRGFHKNCVQRKVRRAEREGLVCEEGRSPELLRKFYGLQIITRRRQHLPPQPFAWFRNLAACMGGKLKIRVASKDGKPVASILTLQHRRTLVYKYGCSDRVFDNLGGTPLLFWRAIQDAESEGLSEFDLGRSDWENEGLIRFKDRLGATRSAVTYWRYPASAAAHARSAWQMHAAKRIVACLPDACLSAVGKLLYRHAG
jgi:lipid II:glycine glycyltransferase (peptidoglycan interpeptide bridge formation enzyme)